MIMNLIHTNAIDASTTEKTNVGDPNAHLHHHHNLHTRPNFIPEEKEMEDNEMHDDDYGHFYDFQPTTTYTTPTTTSSDDCYSPAGSNCSDISLVTMKDDTSEVQLPHFEMMLPHSNHSFKSLQLSSLTFHPSVKSIGSSSSSSSCSAATCTSSSTSTTTSYFNPPLSKRKREHSPEHLVPRPFLKRKRNIQTLNANETMMIR